MPTWLITGCSTGLGRALAQAVLDRGHNAVVTARDVAGVQDLQDAHPDTAQALALDVTDPLQVTEAVRAAVERFDSVDVLVNNAGYGYRAAVEEGDEAQVRELFDTNLFGAIAMVKAVLPGMRSRRAGAIVNISSIGARIAPPGSGYYAASKAALEAMSASLLKEVAPLGIKVVVVEPGGFRTDFAGRSLQQSPGSIADYAETAGPRRKENDRVHGTQPGDPVKAAQAMITAVESENPPAMLLLGQDSLDGFRAVSTAVGNEVAAWEHLSVSTGSTNEPPAQGCSVACVLVTGGSRGIGAGISQVLAARGDRIAIHCRSNLTAARTLLAELPGEGHVVLAADLADDRSVAGLVHAAVDALGTIDVLVNNAGIYSDHPIGRTGYEAWMAGWRDTLGVNLLGAAAVTWQVVDHLLHREQGPAGGRIVMVGSRGAYRGEPTAPAYGASKAGLHALTQSLAVALAPEGIVVNGVAPGFVATEMTAQLLAGPAGAGIRAQSPFGRVGEVTDIAAAVAWLSSPEARWTSGAILDANGASYLR